MKELEDLKKLRDTVRVPWREFFDRRIAALETALRKDRERQQVGSVSWWRGA